MKGFYGINSNYASDEMINDPATEFSAPKEKLR